MAPFHSQPIDGDSEVSEEMLIDMDAELECIKAVKENTNHTKETEVGRQAEAELDAKELHEKELEGKYHKKTPPA
ncbi:hypothetical protein DXG01_014411 [Tephrocybe rancida]|nr:hypothetical protein DXG01_014411 [Tephrocybe rancida]